MANELYSGKHMRYGVKEQTVFGTGELDTADFIQLQCEPIVINPDVKHRTPLRAIAQLHPDKSSVFNDKLGSIPSCVIKTEALKKELALWLHLIFQNVVEIETTPFQKTFTFPNVGPNFSADDGEFITLISRAPAASVSEKVHSMIAQKLSLSLSAGANNGNLAAEISLLGKGHIRTSNPATGIWTKTASELFNFHNFNVCTLDTPAVILESWKLDIENMFVAKGSDGAGSFQNWVLTSQSINMQISGLWDAATRAGLTALDVGSEVIQVLGWGTTGTDGFLEFTTHGIVESGAPEEGDARLVNLNIKGISDVANTEAIETVKLADAKNWTW